MPRIRPKSRCDASKALLAKAPPQLEGFLKTSNDPRRAISRGDSLIFDKKKAGKEARVSIDVPTPPKGGILREGSPSTPRTPRSPALTGSLSLDNQELDKFRTSTLLNGRTSSSNSQISTFYSTPSIDIPNSSTKSLDGLPPPPPGSPPKLGTR